MTFRRFWRPLAALGLAGFLAGCGASTVSNTPTNSPVANQSQQLPYPPLNPTQLAQTPITSIDGPNFKLNPIAPGATQVSGEGPFGLNIVIINVSQNGQTLATTTINDQGTFTVMLPSPTVADEVIGIQLPADATATQNIVDALPQKGGARFRVYPQLGAVYDSVVVE